MDTELINAMRTAGIELIERGRKLVGLCPFHNDRHPSLFISEDRGAWYCHVCAFGGNAIEFVKRLHGTDLKGAVKLLGKPEQRKPDPIRSEAVIAHQWAQKTLKRLNWIVYNLGKKIQTLGIAENDFENALAREWVILCDLEEDLSAHKFVEFPKTEWRERGKAGTWAKDTERILELWHNRQRVESILESHEVCKKNKVGFSIFHGTGS